MTTGILTALAACLTLGQAGSDLFHTNQRQHDIPVNIQESRRADIRELLLYASTNHGKDWQQVGVITPEKAGFPFYATKDGIYWLRVALVTKRGVQEPDDKAIMSGQPDLKMIVDTTQPIVKSMQAQRDGDDVFVTWDVQEEHFDYTPNAMRLEYRAKDSISDVWKITKIVPGLKGQARFRVDTKQAVVIRLTARDLAGNQ